MGIGTITYKIAAEAGVATDDGKKFTRTARLTYQANSTTPAQDNVNTMQNYYGAPRAGMNHPYIPFMNATRVNCRKTNEVMYEFDVDFLGYGKPGESPLDQPPKITYDFAVSEEAYDVDYEGKPIVFVTGEQLDPPLKDTVYDIVIRCQRNLAWVDPDVMSRYAGAINSDVVFGVLPPGTCKITEPPKATSVPFNNGIYWDCMMGMTVRRGIPGVFDDEKAWWKRVLAQGYYVSTVTNFNKVTRHARDKEGDKVTKPVLHYKKTGYKLPYVTATGFQDQSLAEWYEFKPRKPPLPFAALNIF